MDKEIALLDALPEGKKPIKYFFTLVELRKTHKMSQTELAEVLGVDQSYVSMLETGRETASAELLEKIATFFDVSIDYLHQDAYTIETAKQIIAEQVQQIHRKGLEITKADRTFLLQVIRALQPQIMVEESITQRVNSDGTQAYERAVKKLQAFEENNK